MVKDKFDFRAELAMHGAGNKHTVKVQNQRRAFVNTVAACKVYRVRIFSAGLRQSRLQH